MFVFFRERLTVTDCLQHPWFTLFDDAVASLSTTVSLEIESMVSSSVSLLEKELLPQRSSTPEPEVCPRSSPLSSSKVDSDSSQGTNSVDGKSSVTRAVSSHTENIYSKPKTAPLRIGLSANRRDTFKKNMESLAQKFSTSTEIVILEGSGSSSSQRRATATHTMPAGEVFKCMPVFILGEEQQCSDSGSDTVSEISTDSSSDRSSIYSDDSLDFILYGKSQGRASFPFTGAESDR